MDYLIVGSGLFGSVFAYEAAKRGLKCLVLEKRNHVGGNIYCEQKEDINIHRYGAHIFHTSIKEVWEYINQFAEFNHYINSPIANYKGEIYNLPFNMNTFSKMWNLSKPGEAHNIIETQRLEVEGEPKNLEEQAISLVGRDIYLKLIKGYTEKQWGRDCRDLPADIIKRLPVRFCYDNNYFNDCYQGIPKGGYNQIIEKMLVGSEVLLNVDYNKPEIRSKYEKMAKRIIYTGPIDAYYHYQYGKLEYRSLKFETERFENVNMQGVAVINYTDRETPYTRTIEHKHFEFGMQPVTYVTKEYSLEWEEGQEPFYPVNNEKNLMCLNQYQHLAKSSSNVLFGGRLAEYRYYDMDKTIKSALDAVHNELA